MKISRKLLFRILSIALPAIILPTAAYLAFFRPAPPGEFTELIASVPDDMTIIAEIGQPKTLLKEASQSTIWQDIRKTERMKVFRNDLHEMDSLIRTYPSLSGILAGYPIIAALQLSEDKGPAVLIIFEVPSLNQRKIIRRFIHEATKGGQTSTGAYRGKKITSVMGPQGKINFQYAFIGNRFIGSTDTLLHKRSIDLIMDKSQGPWDEPSFVKAYHTAGKMVHTHLFLNSSELKNALVSLLDTNSRALISTRHFPDGWTAFDVTMGRNELTLTGFTTFDDEENLFCQLYATYDPEDLKIHKILPGNTVFSIQMTTGNFDEFFRKMSNGKIKTDTLFRENFRSWMDPSMQLDLEKRIPSIAGPEICLAITGSRHASLRESTYIIIRSEQIETGRVSLDLLSDPAQNARLLMSDQLIRKLSIPNPFLTLYSPLPADNLMEWYTLHDNYIIFGESPAALQRFISYLLTGRTIGNNPQLAEFLDHFPDRSNLSLNGNIRNAGEAMISLLNDSLAAAVNRERDLLNRFDGLAIHFSLMDDMLFTHLHLTYNPDYVEESPYLWKARLDTTIRKGPWLILNPQTSMGNIVAYDVSDQLYLIGEDGEIRWKKSLSGSVLSDVSVVEKGQDHQPHLLCNTADSVYLIRFDGQHAPGFPIPIASGASNGLTVLDYDHDGAYRIVLATNDRKILNFDLDGNPVKGWATPATDSVMVKPMEHLVAAGKDYLIFPLRGGRVLITDRKGKVRLQPARSFVHSGQSDFYVNHAGTEGIIFTTDIYGNVIYLAPNGSLKKISFGDFLPGHHFLSADFNGDQQDDFIFLDQNQLTVFNRKKEKIAAFTFPEEIRDPPLLFERTPNRTYLGFFSAASGNIYLLSAEGQVQWTTEMKSDRPFQVGYLDNRTTLHLITGYKYEIFNYLFE